MAENQNGSILWDFHGIYRLWITIGTVVKMVTTKHGTIRIIMGLLMIIVSNYQQLKDLGIWNGIMTIEKIETCLFWENNGSEPSTPWIIVGILVTNHLFHAIKFCHQKNGNVASSYQKYSGRCHESWREIRIKSSKTSAARARVVFVALSYHPEAARNSHRSSRVVWRCPFRLPGRGYPSQSSSILDWYFPW